MPKNEIPFEKLEFGIKQGILIVENLLKDSEILLKKKRYASSISLAILAYEEISKQNILRLQLKQGKPFPWKTWIVLSSGGQGHSTKLSDMMLKKKINLEKKGSSKIDSYINKINTDFGFPPLADHKMAQIEAEFLVHLLPKLNNVKKDCFYLDYDLKNQKWTHFENRFDMKTKEAIAIFVIHLAKRTTAYQKFLMDIPGKPFEKYTKIDFNNVKKLKSRKNLKKILEQTNDKKSVYLNDIAMIAIDTYPEPKKRK